MPDPARVHAVVFDLDGLMFNTEQLYQQVGAELLRRRGKVFDSVLLNKIMGRPGAVAFQIMIDEHSLPDTVQILADESDEIFKDILDEQLKLMPGLERLLGFACKPPTFPNAIATSSGADRNSSPGDARTVPTSPRDFQKFIH